MAAATIFNTTNGDLVLSSYIKGTETWGQAHTVTIGARQTGLLRGPSSNSHTFQVHVWYPGVAGITSPARRLTSGNGIKVTPSILSLTRSVKAFSDGHYVRLESAATTAAAGIE